MPLLFFLSVRGVNHRRRTGLLPCGGPANCLLLPPLLLPPPLADGLGRELYGVVAAEWPRHGVLSCVAAEVVRGAPCLTDCGSVRGRRRGGAVKKQTRARAQAESGL